MSDGGELAEVLRRIFERPRSEVAPSEILGVLGTSNNDGNTAALARAVFAPLPNAALVNLNDLAIAPYDYLNRHDNDDFLPLAEKLAAAKTIVFASPVYWYAMSAQMKLFFDRLTDLTGAHKQLGKALAGKSVFLIATGGSPLPPASFEPPFSETARYFSMRWGGMLYQPGDKPVDAGAAKDFSNRIAGGIREASVRAA
ncbi:MAG: flavodoxin family protein [Alphaproteobacteria bacterium]|nr:flavodoxin family protein [Alphaproteobacteria bacterium]